MNEPRTNLLTLDRQSMAGYFAAMGERPFRAGQVLQWIYQRGATGFDHMTDLSKDLRSRLAAEAEIRLPKILRCQRSNDGTRKWLLQLGDGNCVESVFIPDGERGTLCVSSQVGCSLNCTFCATARQGFSRNLEVDEIIGQVLLAEGELSAGDGERTLTNIVLMGMGEPLLNYGNVVSAMRLMLDDYSFGFSRRRVTLSTAGLVPAMDQLSRDCPVSLAVSLHAANDALRDQLVPLNRKYPIAELLAACGRYVAQKNRERITFEYVLLRGINDSLADARALARLLVEIPAKVNLIPFNPSFGIDYRASDHDTVNRFRDILMAKRIMTVTRKTRGGDIDAACGQLAGKVRDRTRRSMRANLSDSRKCAPSSH
ncbi:MAG: 23S rRNA (adenine(2503)-C(2))-methyltransferase RlmN [Pseudomonadota bacterium]|nr:23S rRNA (adenine(2503)-C(2))-methyltransferase RlmN [Pseudomonadota bacterium]